MDGASAEAGKVKAGKKGTTAPGQRARKRSPVGAGAPATPSTRNQVTCPGCSTKLAVGTDKRPFSFNCPKCSRRITLEARPGETPVAPSQAAPGPAAPSTAPPAATGTEITCPRCLSKLNVATTRRPFSFNCPKCTQRITLQAPGQGPPGRPPLPGTRPGYPPRYDGMPPGPGRPGGYPPAGYPGAGAGYRPGPQSRPPPVPGPRPYGQEGYPAGPTGAPPGTGPPGTTIQCPGCRAQLDISRMPRPSTFNCPSCQLSIEIR